MQHQEFVPPHEVADAIKCFWYNDNDFGPQRACFEVVPDGYAEIIFYFGNLYPVPYKDGLQPLPSPFMMGLLDKPAAFYTQCRLQIMAVRCYPWAVFDLLGLPPAGEGIHTFQHPVAGLQSALSKCMDAADIDKAVALLAEYFTAAMARIPINSMLSKAGMAMRSANGNMHVSDVAAAAHATVRTLERQFRQSSGHTVKDVSGLIRFEQVRNYLWLHPGANLAGLAADMGYADQSHLSREFKRYSGITPAAFARNAKQGKAMTAKDIVAFIQE